MKKQAYHASVWREGKWYVAQCLEIEMASQGKSIKEALDNLKEALELKLDKTTDLIPPAIYKLGHRKHEAIILPKS